MIIFLLFSVSMIGQTVEKENVIYLEKKKGNKKRIIFEDVKITCWTEKEKPSKGKLLSITDSVIVVDSSIILLDSLRAIKAKSYLTDMDNLLTHTVFYSVTATSGIGTTLVIIGHRTGGCGYAFAGTGYVILVVGLPVMVISIWPHIFKTKKFDLDKKWKLEITEIVKEKDYQE